MHKQRRECCMTNIVARNKLTGCEELRRRTLDSRRFCLWSVNDKKLHGGERRRAFLLQLREFYYSNHPILPVKMCSIQYRQCPPLRTTIQNSRKYNAHLRT